jgi:hypothetical protein
MRNSIVAGFGREADKVRATHDGHEFLSSVFLARVYGYSSAILPRKPPIACGERRPIRLIDFLTAKRQSSGTVMGMLCRYSRTRRVMRKALSLVAKAAISGLLLYFALDLVNIETVGDRLRQIDPSWR